jgi:hypothetical protein
MKLTRAMDIVIGSVELQASHPELFHYTRWLASKPSFDRTRFGRRIFSILPDERKLTVLKPLLLEM